jgi:hypothetical protein
MGDVMLVYDTNLKLLAAMPIIRVRRPRVAEDVADGICGFCGIDVRIGVVRRANGLVAERRLSKLGRLPIEEIPQASPCAMRLQVLAVNAETSPFTESLHH